jgi:nitrite reductase/ring-hydroxylating ferredoxin subunit
MPQFVKLASTSELPPAGEVKEFVLGEKMICVANVDGNITALDNVCLHVGGTLGQGVIEGGRLIGNTIPRPGRRGRIRKHGWRSTASRSRTGT